MNQDDSYGRLEQQIKKLNDKIFYLQDQLSLLKTGKNAHSSKQIKVPVLLAKIDVQIDLDKEVIIPYPVRSLSHVDWELKGLTCHSPSLSNKAFVDGILKVQIYFDTVFPPYPILSVTEEIAFKKRKDFHYYYPPLPPQALNKKEYSFITDHSSDHVITHQENNMGVNNQIICDLSHQQILSSESMEIRNNKTYIDLQASVTFLFNLLQQQLIPLL